MTRLALVAVLLMIIAPVVSRWMASSSVQMLGLTEMCTSTGLKLVDLKNPSSEILKAPLPAPDHFGMNADCAYCPMLADVVLLLLTLALLAPLIQRIIPPRTGDWLPRPASVFPGLGSQGPPLAL